MDGKKNRRWPAGTSGSSADSQGSLRRFPAPRLPGMMPGRMPTRWLLLGLLGLGCAAGGPSAAERELQEQANRLTAERNECRAQVDDLAAYATDLQAQLEKQKNVALAMSHSMLDKAEAVALMKLQLIAFQRAVADTAGIVMEDDLADMEPDLKAQIARIHNMRQNLPPRPIDTFDQEQERTLIEARERVLGR